MEALELYCKALVFILGWQRNQSNFAVVFCFVGNRSYEFCVNAKYIKTWLTCFITREVYSDNVTDVECFCYYQGSQSKSKDLYQC